MDGSKKERKQRVKVAETHYGNLQYILVKHKMTSGRGMPFSFITLAPASFNIGMMFQRRKVGIGFLSGFAPHWERRHYGFGHCSPLTYISTLIL